jgi:glycine cleavage system H protein
MKIDQEARYLESHEWARMDGDVATIGISDHAQESLSDIVYVELPEIGDSFDKGDSFGVVESVKAASDVYMPIGGEITEVNLDLEEEPEKINQDAYGTGWLIKVKPSDLDEFDELIDAAAYEALVAEEEG